tara:strand:- start:706 stop:1032 length:327 start_codon:yes stop_codon:yes gene_type:complete
MCIYSIFKYKGFKADDFKTAILVINKHQVNILKHTWFTRLLSDIISVVLAGVANWKKILIWILKTFEERILYRFTGLTYRLIIIILAALFLIWLVSLLWFFIDVILLR